MGTIKTRQILIDVARRLFAQNGIDNTTMNDIAVESGKGRRTLYTYFKSKEEVFSAVIEKEMERMSDRLRAVADKDLEPEDKLVQLVYTHLSLIKEAVVRNGNLRAEFFRNIWLVEKVRKQFDRAEVDIIQDIIMQGIRQGKLDVANIRLSRHGGSTLGGRKVWFDPDVKRLNYDGQGDYLGEFNSDEQILVIRRNGEFYVTNFDVNNHYEDDILRIEKYNSGKVWTACLFDADQQGYAYMKRFTLEATVRHQSYLGENPDSQLILLTDTPYPHLLVTMGGADDFREPLDIEAEDFIGVKSFKAKGKRITTCNVAKIEELEPTRWPEPTNTEDKEKTEDTEEEVEEEQSQDEVADQLNGQLRLFE